MSQKKDLAMRVSPEDFDRLNQLADEMKWTKSQILRELVKLNFSENSNGQLREKLLRYKIENIFRAFK